MTPLQNWKWYWKSVPRTPQHGGGVSVWLYNWWTQRFTGPGKSVLVIWVSLLAVAAVPGWDGAFVPLGILFFGLLLGWISTALPLRLDAEWRFPSSIYESSEFSLIINIHNGTPREMKDAGAWFFWADEWLRASGEAASVSKIPAGSTLSISVPMYAKRRGPHRLRGPLVYQLDPTGLFRRRRQIQQPSIVLVRPRPVFREIEPFLISGTRGQEFSRILQPQHHRSLELLGVREYRDGDEIRDIHHKTWARLGKPFTKEFGKERGAGVVFVVETGCLRYVERSGVDAMLRIAAGIGIWLGERNLLGRFVLDGVEVELPSNREAVNVLLDRLAAVPVPLWWKWPEPKPFNPVAHTLGPVLTIGCSTEWVQQKMSYEGGIQKRILVSFDSPKPGFEEGLLLWIPAGEAQ